MKESEKQVYGLKKNWFIFGNDSPITNWQVRNRKNVLRKPLKLKQKT